MRLAQAFSETKVSHLDLTGFARLPASTSVAEALEQMRVSRSTVVLVEGEGHGKLVGIFTERDVLLKIADSTDALGDSVSDLMTSNPQVLTVDDTVSEALSLMSGGHYRNVPVLSEGGQIVGNLSQHAVIRFLTDHFPREIYNLPPDPELIPRTREGA